MHAQLTAEKNNDKSEEMPSDQLKILSKKCRCCLQNAKDNERLEIGEIIREKFFEAFEFSLSYSSELSQIICSNCFSILSQYSAIKKRFLENQNLLHALLKRQEQTKVYVKVEVIGEQHHDELNSENQKKKIESLYRVEEVVDDVQVKRIEHHPVQSVKELPPPLQEKTPKVSNPRKNRLKITKCKSETEESSKYLCSECGVEFTRVSCLKRHIDIIHRKLKRFECDNCNYRCYKKESIRKHAITHLPQTEKCLHECARCPGRMFSSIYSLKLHDQNFHRLNQKQFQCNYQNCQRAFSREISLKEHVRFVHLKCRPISCDQCEASFANKNHLRRHETRKHKTTQESVNSNNLLL